MRIEVVANGFIVTREPSMHIDGERHVFTTAKQATAFISRNLKAPKEGKMDNIKMGAGMALIRAEERRRD